LPYALCPPNLNAERKHCPLPFQILSVQIRITLRIESIACVIHEYTKFSYSFVIENFCWLAYFNHVIFELNFAIAHSTAELSEIVFRAYLMTANWRLTPIGRASCDQKPIKIFSSFFTFSVFSLNSIFCKCVICATCFIRRSSLCKEKILLLT